MRRFRVPETTDLEVGVAGWTPVKLGTTPPSDPGRDGAERAIAEVLQCDHVLVLAGLGTSLCIKDPSSGDSLFPTMGRLWNKVSDTVGADPFTKVQEAVGSGTDKNIEDLLSRCKMRLALGPVSVPDIAAFVAKAEKVIRNECRKKLDAKATEVHEDFLRRVVRRAPRRPRVNLFTTNYDLCFEAAASRIGLPVIDGFSFSMPPRFQAEAFDYNMVTNSSYSKEPDYVPRLLRLFKLHGSVDWHSQDGVITKQGETDTPTLIYPQVGKYQASYSPPFLEVMSRFQGLLRQRNVGVLSICCGFNDQHIAEPVLSAVKSNPSLRMVVCAPDLCDPDAKKLLGDSGAVAATARNDALRQFDHLIENGDARLALVNCSFPTLVRLMPMLGAQTDEEQHEARIKRLETAMAALKAKTAPAA